MLSEIQDWVRVQPLLMLAATVLGLAGIVSCVPAAAADAVGLYGRPVDVRGEARRRQTAQGKKSGGNKVIAEVAKWTRMRSRINSIGTIAA